MLDLLRFAPGGRFSWEGHSRRAAPFRRECGVELLYVGDGDAPFVTDGVQGRGVVLVARYPDRKACVHMVADPEYRKITRLRSEALSEAVLQTTRPWGSPRDF